MPMRPEDQRALDMISDECNAIVEQIADLEETLQERQCELRRIYERYGHAGFGRAIVFDCGRFQNQN